MVGLILSGLCITFSIMVAAAGFYSGLGPINESLLDFLFTALSALKESQALESEKSIISCAISKAKSLEAGNTCASSEPFEPVRTVADE